jgi:hypothetical protein
LVRELNLCGSLARSLDGMMLACWANQLWYILLG